MTDCTITIAFPVYNVAAYVERSLCSALEQTFPLPYEVLVIDDKGSDGSMAIVSRMQQEHPQGSRIRIIEHKQNKGLGEASNTAIDNARGKYLLFLDSDDRLAPDALQAHIQNTAPGPPMAMAVATPARLPVPTLVATETAKAWKEEMCLCLLLESVRLSVPDIAESANSLNISPIIRN